MGQGCSTHLCLCLDKDLERDAFLTIYKDATIKNKNNDNCKWFPRYDWSNDIAQNTALMREIIAAGPGLAMDTESKLTIMCHAASAPQMAFGNKLITPQNLARLIRATLGAQKIKRISILGCEAGGKKTFRGMAIVPEHSAAYEFARYAGNIALTVTARTGRTLTSAKEVKGVGNFAPVTFIGAAPYEPPKAVKRYEDIKQKVSGIDGRHHGREDKVVFTTNPDSTTGAPLNPTWAYETYGVWD